MQRQSTNQKRVFVRSQDSKQADSMRAVASEDGHRTPHDAHVPKKQKSIAGSGSYTDDSEAMPIHVPTTFFPNEGDASTRYSYGEHQDQHHPNYGSGVDHPSPHLSPPQNLPRRRRAGSYGQHEDYQRHQYHEQELQQQQQLQQQNTSDDYYSRAPPRRARSDRIHRPESFDHPHPSYGGSSNAHVAPNMSFETFPQPMEQEASSPKGVRKAPEPSSPSHHRNEDLRQQRYKPPPPKAQISYVCASARKCFPSTSLGKRIRDQVRDMMEETMLLPVSRSIHYDTQQSQYHDHFFLLLNSAKETLHVHSILGKGNFSLITAVSIKDSSPKTRERKHQQQSQSEHLSHPQSLDRKHSQDRQHHNQPPPRQEKPRYYACKSIKEELLVSNVARMSKLSRNRGNDAHLQQSVEYCVQAATQLAYEAHLLSCLGHPNIVKLRGLDADGILGFERRDHRGFFLLTDVLSETLDQTIDRWRSETAMATLSRTKSRIHTPGFERDTFLLQRHSKKIGICLQVASALEYLHERRIVYRGLKPSNVGFLQEGGPSSKKRVQLFDFGLARELTPKAPNLKGAIGTMRYMAPEVCLEASYDCDCDIYSYAIVCWELWTQKIPFEDVATPDQYREHVCQRGYRPVYHSEDEFRDPRHQQPHYYHDGRPQIQTVPQEILVLLSQAWKQDPRARIRWSKTRNQLELLETLVGLQLEERELSEVSGEISADGCPGHGGPAYGGSGGNPHENPFHMGGEGYM